MRKVNQMMQTVFSNGFILSEKTIYEVCSKALKTIENELPEEARFLEVYYHIIDACKDVLKEKKIVL